MLIGLTLAGGLGLKLGKKRVNSEKNIDWWILINMQKKAKGTIKKIKGGIMNYFFEHLSRNSTQTIIKIPENIRGKKVEARLKLSKKSLLI